MNIDKLHDLFLKYNAICTDTRKVVKNALFFALKGENFNGNEFASDAIGQGAIFAVVDEVEMKPIRDALKPHRGQVYED